MVGEASRVHIAPDAWETGTILGGASMGCGVNDFTVTLEPRN